MLQRHPFRSIGPVRRWAEPGGAAEADRAAQVRGDHFERIVPAVAEEPAAQLRRVEYALVSANAVGTQVGLVPLEIAEPIEPGVRAHP